MGCAAQNVRVCAPRVCGDDPVANNDVKKLITVLPAYAGMIPRQEDAGW